MRSVHYLYFYQVEAMVSNHERTLRFAVEDHVLISTSLGWFEGAVMEIAPSAQIAYSAIRIDTQELISIFRDDDQHVRVLPPDLTPDAEGFDPMMMLNAPPHDPFAHLYNGYRKELNERERRDFDMQVRSLEGLSKVEENPDGTQNVSLNNGQNLTMAFHPVSEDRYGIPGEGVYLISKCLYSRRSIHQCASSIPNFTAIFESMVPTESSLAELERAAKSDCGKMLQLGDALMSGVHGWSHDPVRAANCYYAAAHGCAESQVEGRDGIPVGIPEAMCAVAMIRHNQLQKICGSDYESKLVDIRSAMEHPYAIMFVGQCIYWLASAVRRGWVCPLALEFAEHFETKGLQDHPYLNEKGAKLLSAAFEYRKKEKEIEDLQKNGVLPRGDPSDATIKEFAPKALEIFRSLPVEPMAPSMKGPSDVHIEFREAPIVPFLVIAFIVLPFAEHVMKTVVLPESLQLCPFSKESFRYVWTRIAFELHLGQPLDSPDSPGMRSRPAVFTVLDKMGDREFGTYLRSVIGHNCGTEIRTVTHKYRIVPNDVTISPKRLGDIMKRIELDLVDNLKQMADLGYRTQSPSADHATSGFDLGQNMTLEEKIAEADRLKAEGNKYFGRDRQVAAKGCYTDAICLLRTIVDPDDKVYSLLGVLLSNRAASVLKLIEGLNLETAMHFVKQTIIDCNSALESSWSSCLPETLRKKISRRRDIAVAKKESISQKLHWASENNVGTGDEASEVQVELEETTSTEQSYDEGQENNEERQRGPRHRGRRNRQRRQRDRTRQNRQQQQQASEDDGLTDNLRDIQIVEEDQQSAPPSWRLSLGQDLLEFAFAKNVTTSDDLCPICTCRFRVELAESFVVVLLCQHAHCLQCVSKLRTHSGRSSAKTPFACSMCRVPVDHRILNDVSNHIIESVAEVRNLMVLLPLADEESKNVMQCLLKTHQFQLEPVQNAIESMLVDNMQANLWRDKSLTYEQKNEIYEQARRPVQLLYKELCDAQVELRQIRDYESEEWISCHNNVGRIRKKLSAARRNASIDIFNLVNSAGGMGKESESGGLLYLDFHGLHVEEAINKFDSDIKPILPVVHKVAIITGRGIHSFGGLSVLKTALMEHVDKDENRRKMKWESVQGNDGAIVVIWKNRP